MNYLTHFYLADHTQTSIVGALLGDFVKGSHWQSHPRAEQVGILLHRRIDSWTDQWVVNSGLILLAPKQQRRFFGIALDVYFDHLLATHWNQFHSSPLEGFTQEVYQSLLIADVNEKPHQVIQNMTHYDWLCSYQHVAVIKRALTKIGMRLKRVQPLAELLPHMEQNRPQIQQTFFEGLSELEKHCQQWTIELQASRAC